MILGEGNAWSNFSYGSRIDTPTVAFLIPRGAD